MVMSHCIAAESLARPVRLNVLPQITAAVDELSMFGAIHPQIVLHAPVCRPRHCLKPLEARKFFARVVVSTYRAGPPEPRQHAPKWSAARLCTGPVQLHNDTGVIRLRTSTSGEYLPTAEP